MKKAIRLLAVLLILVLSVSVLAACGGGNGGGNTSEGGVATVILVDEDLTEYTYEVPAGLNLRDALHEAGLIDDQQFTNMFVETIDGHTALMEDGVLWMMADQDKNQIQGFFEEHVLADGETLYLLFTVAPNFDD
ncbi:MAG: hypothetical protein IJT40_04570 [Firmicutes bacterium]|nr:hypothetical protein [Bacillota bacterium]